MDPFLSLCSHSSSPSSPSFSVTCTYVGTTHAPLTNTQVAYVRKCPRLLFHEEQEQQHVEDEERLSRQLLQDRQSLEHDTNESIINHSNHAAPAASSGVSAGGASSCMRQDNEQDVTNSVKMHSSTSSSQGQDQSFAKKTAKYSRYLEFAICPEVGLSKQGFKCAECEEVIAFSTSRICDYDGQYYCFSCHWNDTERTPARILHNWDFSPKPVSRRSLQLITFICRQPVLFDVLDFNPMLYGLVEDLPLVKVRSA